MSAHNVGLVSLVSKKAHFIIVSVQIERCVAPSEKTALCSID